MIKEPYVPPKQQPGAASGEQTRVTIPVTNSNIALAHSAFKDIGILIVNE